MALTDRRVGAALVIDLGQPGEIPVAMRADGLFPDIPRATCLAVPGARHFSFLARCSAFGRVVTALAGDDDICSDRGLRDRREVQAEIGASVAAFFKDGL